MEDYIWTFERAGARLEIRRQPGVGATRLVITSGDEPRSYEFADTARLVEFQSDMEALLLATGWSFVEFSPERRTGRDRRTWPRITERRRWWTDGLRIPLPGRRSQRSR